MSRKPTNFLEGLSKEQIQEFSEYDLKAIAHEERQMRAQMAELDEQYKIILRDLKACEKHMERLERLRLTVEASKKAVTQCLDYNKSGLSKKGQAKAKKEAFLQKMRQSMEAQGLAPSVIQQLMAGLA